MSVAGDECQIVLEGERRDPEIVVRDGRACALQLNEEPGVLFRSLPPGRQNSHCAPRQQGRQQCFVSRRTVSSVKTGFHFGEDDKRNPNLFAGAHLSREALVATKEISQSVRIERGPHLRCLFPLLRINLSLRSYDFIESGIGSPLPDEVHEIGPDRVAYRGKREFIKHHLVQALFPLRRFLAESAVDLRRNAADGVLNRMVCLLLHAYILACCAGMIGEPGLFAAGWSV